MPKEKMSLAEAQQRLMALTSKLEGEDTEAIAVTLDWLNWYRAQNRESFATVFPTMTETS